LLWLRLEFMSVSSSLCSKAIKYIPRSPRSTSR
jgi:hypothetical protein